MAPQITSLGIPADIGHLGQELRPTPAAGDFSAPEPEGNALRGICFALPISLAFWGAVVALIAHAARSGS